MPKRIQLSRKKGWRKPKGCIVVSRPSMWGNPFRVGHTSVSYIGHACPQDASEAVAFFKRWLMEMEGPQTRNRIRRELGGHDLACWCRLDQPCHADVLLEIANSPMEEL